MITLFLILIVLELAALIYLAVDGKLTGPKGEQGAPGAPGPSATPQPAAPQTASVADTGIWELLEWHHDHFRHKSWVREGTSAWEVGRKAGHALKRGSELIEGNQ